MKYDEIMDRIEVTPQMRHRILHSLEEAREKKKKRFLLRQVVSIAACLTIVLCCWYVWMPGQQEQDVQAIPQIEEVGSLQALSRETGIPLKELTGLPFEISETEYVSYWEELAEIQYLGQADSLRYRKSEGTEDNSGDYTVYQQEINLTISGCSVTLKGSGEGYCLAVWTDGTYAYSISVTAPLSEEAFQNLLETNF